MLKNIILKENKLRQVTL